MLLQILLESLMWPSDCWLWAFLPTTSRPLVVLLTFCQNILNLSIPITTWFGILPRRNTTTPNLRIRYVKALMFSPKYQVPSIKYRDETYGDLAIASAARSCLAQIYVHYHLFLSDLHDSIIFFVFFTFLRFSSLTFQATRLLLSSAFLSYSLLYTLGWKKIGKT